MQKMRTGYLGKRNSGISLIGDLPWGSHFCQFHQTQEELLEILVPYFKAGLEDNEFCLWVSGSVREAKNANEALKESLPQFEEHVREGQAAVISTNQWLTGDPEFGSAVVSKLDEVISRGFDGLRLAFNVFSGNGEHPAITRSDVDAMPGYNVIAAFSYHRQKFDAVGLMEVMRNHHLALVKNAGRWEVIESSQARIARNAMSRGEEKLRSVFSNMSEGFAYHRIILDAQRRPCDYVFLEVNESFEQLTGLSADDVLGKRVTEALPGIEKDPTDWIGRYGKVALTGKSARFESYSEALDRWYSISAFSPHKGFLAVTFSDITEQKTAEQALRDANERLQNQAEELQVQQEELQTQTEELQTQTEELSAQTEELRTANQQLRNSEQALRESEQRLSRAQEIAHLGSWELNLVSGALTWSDEVYRIFGLQPQEFEATYEAFLETVHPDDRAVVDAAYSDSLKEGRLTYEFEHRIVRSGTSEIRWVHEKCRHVKDAEGKIIFSMGMVLDITERKVAEESIRRSEERFRLLSETAGRLLSAENPQEIVNELCSKVMEHLDCHAFFNYMVDGPECRLRLNACAGIPDEEVSKLEWLECGAAVCGCVARDGARIVAQDIPANPDPRTDLVASYGIKAYACHPLPAGGKVIGTLSFGTRTRAYFSDEDLSLMKTVADQVAIAMQRILAERAIRDSEQRLRWALEGGRMGRWEWDITKDSSFWDERVYELLDLEPGASAGSKAFFSRVNQSDRDALRELIRKTAAVGGNLETEFRVRKRGRGFRWLAMRGLVTHENENRTSRMFTVLYDVTPRKQMEAEMRRLNDELEEQVQAQTEELKDNVQRLEEQIGRRVLAEEQLRRRSRLLEGFFGHTITPLAFMDRNFNFVRVNEAYAQADEKTCDYFVGKNHFALYPNQENEAIFRRVVETKQPYRAFAKPFSYPENPERGTSYWNWQLTPLLDERGEVESLVLNLEDVTEQRAAVLELEHRARQLQKLTLELSEAEDRERKRLAEILHDDLQQQLVAAKYHLRILSNRLKNDDEARHTTTQVGEMIDDAVTKSRSLSHELSPAVLHHDDLSEMFAWLANQVRIKHGLAVQVVADRIQVQSDTLRAFMYKAAQEMLFNVVKHARVKRARIRVRRRARHVCLAVSDCGRGFDPKQLNDSEGFGLLSIRERVKLLGGRMNIRSTAGAGSRFVITVPDQAPDSSCVLSTSSVVGRRSSFVDRRSSVEIRDTTYDIRDTRYTERKRRIFRVVIADDHETVRQGLATLLAEEPDMELVGQAANGRDAIDLTYRLRPDVVVMDVSMPLMSGEEATRQIKAHISGTRVIALSMSAEPDTAKRMREAGAETYLVKTDPSEALLAAIRGR